MRRGALFRLMTMLSGTYLAPGCGSNGTPAACATDDECGHGRECVGGRCVAPDGWADDADVPETVVCMDEDGDLRGRGCAAGADCDDTDPDRYEDCESCLGGFPPAGCRCLLEGATAPCYEGPPGTLGIGVCAAGVRFCDDTLHLGEACEGQVVPGSREVCDSLGRDDDCDGEGDESLLGACGDCDSTCRTEGDVEPDAGDPRAAGLIPNPDGPGVTLGYDELAAGYAWIANADEGTVSKLDLVTGQEAARYRVGLTGTLVDSPSRTAVDGVGNAYAASRAHVSGEMSQGSVTKMAGDGRYCVDRNGNTVIDTAVGAVPMPFGRDECVLWTVPVCGEGGIPRAVALDAGDAFGPHGYPWIGCWSEMRMMRLDPGNGAPMASVNVDVNPYGAAVASDGAVWIAGMRPLPGFIQRFDPATGEVNDRIATEGTPCSSIDDLDRAPYGITTDLAGRVWVTSFDRWACRYDPSDGSWFTVSLPRTVSRGIAAAADGRIWVSNYDWGGNAIVSFVGADGTDIEIHDLGGVAPIGVGLDEIGRVWTVNQTSNTASRLDRATGRIDHFPVGLGPYTYSDFTGYHRRTMIPRGTWIRDYERCADGSGDRWGTLSWDADVPPGSSITFVAATAATPSRLAAAPSITLARVPTAVPPVDIAAAFAVAGMETYRLLRLTVIIEATAGAGAPVLREIRVEWHCSRLE